MVSLELEEASLLASSPIEEPVAGRVWFVIDGSDFPGAGWDDFPISVLSSAVNAFRELVQGEPEAFSYFFDGPYYLYYERLPTTGSVVAIQANCDRRDPPELIASTEIRLNDLRDALLRSVELPLAALAKGDASESVHPLVLNMVDFLRSIEVD